MKVTGDKIKTYMDGKLMVETKDTTYKDGRSDLVGRNSTVVLEFLLLVQLIIMES